MYFELFIIILCLLMREIIYIHIYYIYGVYLNNSKDCSVCFLVELACHVEGFVMVNSSLINYNYSY